MSNNEIEPVATAQELLVFDVRVGRIVQRVALGEQRGPVRIEAVDDSGVLVGLEETRLIYFPRVSEAQSIPR